MYDSKSSKAAEIQNQSIVLVFGVCDISDLFHIIHNLPSPPLADSALFVGISDAHEQYEPSAFDSKSFKKAPQNGPLLFRMLLYFLVCFAG